MERVKQTSIEQNILGIRPSNTKISQCICTVWSESLMETLWVAKGPSVLQAENLDYGQTVQTDLNLPCMHMPTCTLCWILAQIAISFTKQYIRGSRGRGLGGPDPPEKSQKIRVFWQYWSGSPEKSQSFQASIHCWVTIGMPAKR